MVIDFHSHILPGIDDGSPTVETSIEMLRREAEQGITHVALTPHFYPRHDDPRRFLARRDRAERLLREEMEKHSGLPEVHVGAEVGFFRGISDSEYLTELTIGGGILIEMPPGPWPEEYFRELEDIWTRRRIRPLIAHIDRCIGCLRGWGIPGRLARMPVFVQANAAFFLDRSTAAKALWMLKKGQIQLLGSDCHDLSGRGPDLGPAVERIRRRLGPEAMDRITAWSREILNV